MNSDRVIRATALQDQLRIIAVDSTLTAQTCRDLHDLSPLATIMMSKLISAVALMGIELKQSDAELSIRLDGEGPLKGALAIVNGQGNLRAYAFEPHLFLADQSANLDPGRQLLPGTMTIIKSYRMKQPYSGMIELVSGNIAEDLAHYFDQSEQLPTAVNLGVLVDNEARIRASGGFLIQQLPLADPQVVDQIIYNLSNTPNVSDLMDMGLTIEDVLGRFVLKDIDWTRLESKPIEYRCNCSKQRFARALKLLGKDELNQMLEGIMPVCHYCNTTYEFYPDDIAALIKQL